jgi:hypothetical protein
MRCLLQGTPANARFIKTTNKRKTMIIVWRGVGLPILMAGGVVAAVIMACFGAGSMAGHTWPPLLAFGAGGALVFFLGHLRAKSGRSDSVYWIPMGGWAVLFLIVGVLWSVGGSSTPVAARPVPAESRNSGDIPIPGERQIPAASPNPQPARPRGVRGVQLQGIVVTTPGHGTAIINDKTVSVGDTVGISTVIAIEPQSVTLQGTNGKVTVLKLSDVRR